MRRLRRQSFLSPGSECYGTFLAKRSKRRCQDVKIRRPLTFRPRLTMRGECEYAAFSLQLGLPSTLIRYKNGVFRKRSSNRRNLKTPALRFSVNGKRWRYDDNEISLIEFYSNTNAKCGPVMLRFQIPPV